MPDVPVQLMGASDRGAEIEGSGGATADEDHAGGGKYDAERRGIGRFPHDGWNSSEDDDGRDPLADERQKAALRSGVSVSGIVSGVESPL